MQENNEIKYLKLEDIIPNRLQPRTEFDEEKLNELAESIKQYGIINPLLVRPVGNKYEIIAGERRYKASKLVGLTRVPVIITNMDDNTSAEVAVIENIQRQDLSALEEAKSYRKLLDQNNITQEELAQKMSKSQSTIANKMRLLNLCDEVQEALENNKISERHARALLQLKDINDQREVLDKIIKERLPVKATENLIKEKLQEKTLDSNQNVIENNIVPEPTLNSNNQEVLFGNDVVSIAELNKKELEKENDNMNNETNMQMNPGVQTPIPEPVAQPTPDAPAFGSRFFPSLEDQEVNVNLNNPFGNPAPVGAPASQPMMENLVDTPAPVAPEPTTPNFMPDQPQPTPIPEVSPISNQTEATTIGMPTMESFENPTLQASPLPEPDFTQPLPNPIVGPQPESITPEPPVAPEPVIPTPPVAPTIEPVASPNPMPEPIAPVQEPVLPDLNAGLTEVPPITEQPINPLPQEPAPLANKTTDNIINAINAIKNLGLSIESIGYKTTIQEEDTPNTYKITIELEK